MRDGSGGISGSGTPSIETRRPSDFNSVNLSKGFLGSSTTGVEMDDLGCVKAECGSHRALITLQGVIGAAPPRVVRFWVKLSVANGRGFRENGLLLMTDYNSDSIS